MNRRTPLGLEGTFDSMPVSDLVQWMIQKNRTGILGVEGGSVRKIITVEAGQVVNAASTDPREYLGQFLINFGLVSEEQLQKAFETQQQTRVMIGKILVMTGTVNEAELDRVLRLKIVETFLDIFLWERGHFNFQPGLKSNEISVVPVSMSLRELLSQGMSRKKIFEQVRNEIPHNGCLLICNEKTIPKDLNPQSSDGVIVQIARQGLSIADMILRFHSLEFPILNQVYQLIQRGWLVVTVDSKQPPKEPEDEIMELNPQPEGQIGSEHYLIESETAIKNHQFDKAVTILRHALAETPYDRKLSEALENAEKCLSIALKTALHLKDRTPFRLPVDPSAMGSKLSPVQRYLLARIDGTRSLQSIIMVSPLKEVDALRAFAALVRDGLVGVR